MLNAIGLLMRLFSYAFFVVTSLVLLGIVLVAAASRQPLSLPMLPLDPEQMLWGTSAIAIGGLAAVLLAWMRKLKWVYPLWAAMTLFSLVKQYFFSAYVFRGRSDLEAALWFTGGALIALVGAIWMLKPRRGRLYS